jgi:hypothetical protein
MKSSPLIIAIAISQVKKFNPFVGGIVTSRIWPQSGISNTFFKSFITRKSLAPIILGFPTVPNRVVYTVLCGAGFQQIFEGVQTSSRTRSNEKNPSTLLRGLRAQDRIRTYTPFRTLRPEHSASTNFATWAFYLFRGANIGKEQVAPKKAAIFIDNPLIRRPWARRGFA